MIFLNIMSKFRKEFYPQTGRFMHHLCHPEKNSLIFLAIVKKKGFIVAKPFCRIWRELHP